jgi:coenzyme Q-binding protein COQ10
MTKFHRVVRLDHKPENLFDLVSDIGKYPGFIRWIQSMDVEYISEDGPKESKVGTARVGFSGFTETMSTEVETDSEEKTIRVTLIKGPLKHLENTWHFKEVDGVCDIDFFVDFEFKNLILRALAAANFELAVNSIMAAFVAEADRRYKS